MSVLVKSMEMPTSCAKCKLFGEYGCPFIGAVGYALTRGERNEDCPLAPVPKHGRLIDADDLIRRCNQHINKYENSIAPQAEYYRDRDKDFIRSLEIAPTVIEAEEDER